MAQKYACPCCNHFTLTDKPPGTFDVCPICYWEDDNLQYENPEREGGANFISLNEAKENFKKYGAISLEFLGSVRLPQQGE